jgi:hypothetical protein
MRPSLLAIAALLPAVAAAQTNILPTTANGIVGNSSNAFPWGTTASTFPGMRIQCIYDSSHFTAAPVPITTPILITNVRWRANETTASWTGGTFSNATLALGTAPIDHAAATTNFATNIGPDYMVVHNGTVTVTPGTGNGTTTPGPYFVDIAVNPPFYYDPNAGDLIVDADYQNGAWAGGTQVSHDVHSAGVLARRVFASSNYPLANGVDSSAPVIEVAFVPAPAGTPAVNALLGAGCVAVADASFYENFTTSAAFDLANTSLTLVRSSEGYQAVAGSAVYVPPSGTATVLTLTDNSQVAVTLSQPMPVGRSATTSTLNVCSNGFICAGTASTTTGTPSATTLLNNVRAFWAVCWHDMNPAIAGGGQVKFEQIGNIAYVTWDGVWDNAGTTAANANTMQAQFDVTTGDVSYVYGAISALGNARLVGFSDAAGSPNGGSVDISSLLPAGFTAASFRLEPLSLGATSRPVLNTSWNLRVDDIPPAGNFGIDIFGLADPGLNDLGFLGMPTCGLRASLDVLNAWLPAGSSHTYSLSVPNNVALLGFQVFTTSAVFVPGVNAFGAITANGVRGVVGDV